MSNKPTRGAVSISITGTAGNVAGGDIVTTTTTEARTNAADLTAEIDALARLLVNVPPEHADTAVAVAATAQGALAQISQDTPNRMLTTISVDGLRAAAEKIGSVLPAVLPIAQRIADTILRMLG
ncbi:MAG: hypothetical protein WCG26_03015 [Chloroflexales bacterium]